MAALTGTCNSLPSASIEDIRAFSPKRRKERDEPSDDLSLSQIISADQRSFERERAVKRSDTAALLRLANIVFDVRLLTDNVSLLLVEEI